MLRSRALAASLLLTAVATACGSDTPSSSPTPKALTKAEWVAGVNKVCVELETDTDDIGEPKTAQEFAEAVGSLVTAMESAQAKVRALPPPAADAAEIEANFYAPNDKQSAAMKAALPDIQAAAAAKDDQAAATAFGQALTAGFDENADQQAEWMKNYGLKDCV